MNGFPKCEHLCLKKDIETLFSAGSRAITIFPLRAVFRVVPREGGPQAQVLVSVAKRRLRHAVDRNRAKRQLREAYRLNKQLIADVLRDDERLHVGLIWLSERPVTSQRVHEKMVVVLHRVAERLRERTAVQETPAAALTDGAMPAASEARRCSSPPYVFTNDISPRSRRLPAVSRRPARNMPLRPSRSTALSRGCGSLCGAFFAAILGEGADMTLCLDRRLKNSCENGFPYP